MEPLLCSDVSLPSLPHVNSCADVRVFSSPQLHEQPDSELSFGLVHPLRYKCKALSQRLFTQVAFTKWELINPSG